MDKTNIIKYRIVAILSSIILCGVSYSTMNSNVPSTNAPFSLTVVIPFFVLNSLFGDGIFSSTLGIVLLPTVYLIICFFTINSCTSTIPTYMKIATLILVALSAIYLLCAWSFGIRYQGLSHTKTIIIYNLGFWVSMLAIYRSNKNQSSLDTTIFYHFLFFSWIIYVSFPWLGELI